MYSASVSYRFINCTNLWVYSNSLRYEIQIYKKFDNKKMENIGQFSLYESVYIDGMKSKKKKLNQACDQ